MDEMVHLHFGGKLIELHRTLSIPLSGPLFDQLSAKLAEYRTRLLEPDLNTHREASTNYKIWILHQLLETGSLDFTALKEAVGAEAENITLSMAYLAYAWKVIENYVYYHGDFNRGGTGLPPLPWTVASTTPMAMAQATA